MDCFTWAKRFLKRNGGEMQHLEPKGGFPATDVLPGDASGFGAYASHTFVVKGGKLYDEFHPKGIDFDLWKKQFMELNKFTAAEFQKFFDLNGIPHPKVPM
jgi:hypothetical protein